MVIFEYRFDILPGKLKEFSEYVEATGRPGWLRCNGTRLPGPGVPP